MILLVVCVSVGGTLLYASLYFKEQMQQEFTRNDGRFKSISRRYLALDEEESLINEYYPRFTELHNNGVIGREQRLNWIEVLRSTAGEMKLPKLNYHIDSRGIYEPEYTINTGKFDLHSSKMNLQAELLHEGDLFRIFDALDRRAKGLYSPTRCSFKISGEVEVRARAPNINVDCELEWYTIKPADGTEINI